MTRKDQVRSVGHFPGWEAILPHLVHPLKVAVIEALAWIGEPLSAPQLANLFQGSAEGFREPKVRYHLGHLVELNVLKVVPDEPTDSGGTGEKFFSFSHLPPVMTCIDCGSRELKMENQETIENNSTVTEI